MKITISLDEARRCAQKHFANINPDESIDVEIDNPSANPSANRSLPLPYDIGTLIPATIAKTMFVKAEGGYVNKIAAIKEVCYFTGWGLKEAKDFVEYWTN